MPNYIVRASRYYSLVIEAASAAQASEAVGYIPWDEWGDMDLSVVLDDPEETSDPAQVKASDYLKERSGEPK